MLTGHFATVQTACDNNAAAIDDPKTLDILDERASRKSTCFNRG